MMMRVGVDLSPAFAGYGGIARYARTMWRHMTTDPSVQPLAFVAGRGVAPDDPAIRHVRLPLRALHAAWATTGHPRIEALVGSVDLVHNLDLRPAPSTAPLVLTWHDTFELSGPEYHHPRSLRLRQVRLQAALNADLVLVTCHSLANEVTERIGISPDRIVVTPLGSDLPPVSSPNAPPVGGPFVFAAGALSPRKGFDVLARAMALLGPMAPPLVIAGPDGWRGADVRRDLLGSLPDGRLLLLGEQYGTVSALYQQATIVVHPSLAEGFGLVCLEAMAAGAAVVAADIPSIREMTAGSARLVPPGDVEALSSAIDELLQDDAARARLGAAAKERAATYKWEGTWARTVEAYRRVARGG